MAFKSYKIELRESNLVRYKGVQPSFELINDTIKKSKLTRNSFEITYGIVKKTIERYLYGLRNLPVVYWHIFYEFDNLEKFYTTFKGVKKRKVSKKKPIHTVAIIGETNKNLIDAIRGRINK